MTGVDIHARNRNNAFTQARREERQFLGVIFDRDFQYRAASRAVNVSMHALNPLNARRARFERITEVLGFADHLPVPELHNAHCVRRLPVVGEDEFGDPEVGSAEYPPHREAFLVRLRETGCLNLMPTADALPRLRILEHGVLLVNLMLRLEVVRVGGGPVVIQSCSNIPVSHLDLPSCMRRVAPLRGGISPGRGEPTRSITAFAASPVHATWAWAAVCARASVDHAGAG